MAWFSVPFPLDGKKLDNVCTIYGKQLLEPEPSGTADVSAAEPSRENGTPESPGF
jgi:hypothetical protein